MNLKIIQRGDRIGMVGDSITYDARWWAALRTGLIAEYPGNDLEFYNLAIPGDSAVDVVERYEWDIAPAHPTLVFVMVGMNDVWREGYAEADPHPEVLQKRREAIRQYAANLRLLMQYMRKDEMRRVILSPTPYEQEASLPEKNLCGVDEALEECSVLAQNIARDTGALYIDLHSPMGEIGRRLRQTDPTATIIGPDRVHPEDLGHAIMGQLVLDHVWPQTRTPYVISIDLISRDGKGQGMSALQFSENRCYWEYSGALPRPAQNFRALELLGQLKRQHLLRVVVDKGDWSLWINGNLVCSADARTWLQGIDLGEIENPLRTQALKIMQAGAEVDREEKRYRNYFMLRLWAKRAQKGTEGKEFINYLDQLASEQPIGHWLRDATADAKRLVSNLPEHYETLTLRRKTLTEAAKPVRFSFDLRRK